MTETVLAVRGLTKRYGGLVAVDRLDLLVPAGEVFGLLGPNGAGKTTTIRMVCGEIPADAGTILFHGRQRSASVRDRVRVGLCPQESVVWEKLTCRAQLEFMAQMYGMPSREGRRRADELLAELDLVDKRSVLAGALSGGLKRRLSIALALVHRPELVVLDEPEAGLDPISRVRIREFIRSLAARSTVLLTTHDMAEADRVCDRLAIMNHGRLVAAGTPDDLKRRLGSGEVIELRFTSGASTATVAAERALAGMDGLRVERSPGLLSVHAARAADALPGVLERMSAASVAADEVRMRGASLEDVFLRLATGVAGWAEVEKEMA